MKLLVFILLFISVAGLIRIHKPIAPGVRSSFSLDLDLPRDYSYYLAIRLFIYDVEVYFSWEEQRHGRRYFLHPDENIPMNVPAVLQVTVTNVIEVKSIYRVEQETMIHTNDIIQNPYEIEKFMFEAWCGQHFYRTGYDYDQRLNIFTENWNFIVKYNGNPNNTVTLSMNQFGHLSNQEFIRYIETVQVADRESVQLRNISKKSIDWTTKGAVTYVKDQSEYDYSWAYAVADSIEGAYFIQTGELVHYSAQQLIDCANTSMKNAFDFIQQNNGLMTEEEYPLFGFQRDCFSSVANTRLLVVKEVIPRTEDELAFALLEQPIAVMLDMTDRVFQFYKKGIIRTCSREYLTHSLLLTGMDTGFWKLKNSWGETWGENGYLRIDRGKEFFGGQCGVASKAFYPKLVPENSRKF